MKLSGNNKIILLGLILLIVAGMVVVVLKGFSLPVEYQKHESINFKIGNNINIEKINEICKSVFGNKKYELREVELFGDSVSVCAQDFSDEEKQNLVEKINAEFGTNFAVPEEKEETAEGAENEAEKTDTEAVTTENAAEAATADATTPDANTETTAQDADAEKTDEDDSTKKEIQVVKIPNYRLRDMVRMYIKPALIVAVIVAVFMLIRYMRINPLVKVVKLVGVLALLELAVLSIVAIVRIPVSPLLINILAGFAMLITAFYLGKLEDELKVLKESKKEN